MAFGSCIIQRFLTRKGIQSDLHINRRKKKKKHRCVESGLEEGIMEPETNDEAVSTVR